MRDQYVSQLALYTPKHPSVASLKRELYGLELQSGGGGTRAPIHRRLPAQDMLDELKRIGIVIVLGNGFYRVLSRSYIPAAADPAKFHAMSVAFTDLAKTLDQNLRPDEDHKLFERRVWAPNGITPEDALEFDALVKDRGQQFLEMVDDWLTDRESKPARFNSDSKVKLGVAMYMFVRPADAAAESVEESKL